MKPLNLSSCLRAALWMLLAMLTLACTPALDWREVNNADSGYRAMFPAKPVVASRDFVMAGQSVTLRLQATTIGSTYFAVGEIPLTEAQQAFAPDILRDLKTSLRNNIGAADASEKAVSASGTVWQEMRANGKLKDGAAAVLAGRFIIQPGRILEVIAMGERSVLTDDVIDQWLGGIRLGPGS